MYVGQTGKLPEERWGKNGIHYVSKKKGKYRHPAFAYAILKYGWNNFEHEIIASNLTKDEANNFEKLLIEKLNTMNSKYGYNLKEGGSNAEPSEESRKKMSESHKGSTRTEESKIKQSETTKGANHYLYGKHRDEETKRKISKSRMGLFTGANHPNAKKIAQCNQQGNLIKIWDNIIEVENALKLNSSNICNCCRGNRKTCGGFIWRYYEDAEMAI